LARQGREKATFHRSLLATFVVAVLAVSAASAASAQRAVHSTADPAAAALEAARGALRRGEPQGALEALRQLRADFPDSPVVADSFALSVECAFATGDEYRGRYFLQRLLEDAPGSPAAFSASLFLARHFYDVRAWLAALEYYRDAIESFREGASGLRTDFDLSLLRAAELALYHAEDPAGAAAYFRRIVAVNLAGAERALYREMRLRLLWGILTPAVLGLNDANVSSLRVDGDDLWVGTWNGGVSRYSVSSGRGDPYPAPAFTRSIEVADRRVWVATSDGLAWYGKSSGRWGTEEFFHSPSPLKVQALRQGGGSLFAGTLGSGLYRLGDTDWAEVSDGALPGKFITCLAEDAARNRLLIGTMNIGLVILDLKNGALSSLAEAAPAFTAKNVTAILPDGKGRVWIGTYGEGLFEWLPETGVLRHFTKATGQITDDWVLSVCETDRALYFGTFGGGVSVLSKGSGAWGRIAIADGLASLDVTAIAWRPPYVFFGTLGAGVSVYDEASDGAQL
jgi:tetratricopeptide (TPR) repeat protein